MDKINKEQLNQVIKDHEKWLNGKGGACANLDTVDLSGVNLSGVNLEGASLKYACLRGADLSFSNLEGASLDNATLDAAVLTGANLAQASLIEACLTKAILIDANLDNANLTEAVLTSADLQRANLFEANLDEAHLYKANLENAVLTRANLRSANLRSAKLDGVDYSATTAFFALQCPEVGSFTAFKKARGGKIVELEIPATAKRSSATTRKCRCDEARVISITSRDGKTNYLETTSDFDEDFIYRVGQIVKVPDFDEDRWEECSKGIHFFLTRQEAVNY